MRMFTTVILCLSVSFFGCGCSLFSYNGAAQSQKADKDVKKQIGKLQDISKPEKTQEHLELEKAAIVRAQEIINEMQEFNNQIKSKLNEKEQKEMEEYINNLNKLMSALMRSVGLPLKEVKLSVDKIVLSLDKNNQSLATKNSKYDDQVKKNNDELNKLNGIANATKTEISSLLDTITFWFWVLVIFSVVISVVAPGGVYLVKRFWTKAFEVSVTAADIAIKAGSDLSYAISKHIDTLEGEDKDKVKQVLKEMPDDAKDYWRKHLRGANESVDMLNNLKSGAAKIIKEKTGIKG